MGLDEVIAANERADARYRRVVLTWIFLLTAVVAVAAAFGWKQ